MGLFWRERVFRRICLREGSPKPIFSKFTGGEGGGSGSDPTPSRIAYVCIHITLNVENQSTESIEQSCSIEVFLNCFDFKHYDKSTLEPAAIIIFLSLGVFACRNLQISEFCAE